MYASELDNNSEQLCKSANHLIPRQLIESSCFCKNGIDAPFTQSNRKTFAVGN